MRYRMESHVFKCQIRPSEKKYIFLTALSRCECCSVEVIGASNVIAEI